jgi:hypothetical protein
MGRGEAAECWLPRGRRGLVDRGERAGPGGVARGASWAVRPGRCLFSFFILKLKIHFGASNKIGKIQIRYRWIRYEKCYNMRLNLEQKHNFYKTKI